MKKKSKVMKMHHMTISAMQQYVHANSIVVSKRRALLQFDHAQTEASIISLTAALAEQKQHKRNLEAQIEGLSAVLGARAV